MNNKKIDELKRSFAVLEKNILDGKTIHSRFNMLSDSDSDFMQIIRIQLTIFKPLLLGLILSKYFL